VGRAPAGSDLPLQVALGLLVAAIVLVVLGMIFAAFVSFEPDPSSSTSGEEVYYSCRHEVSNARGLLRGARV
jgi:hypothetical protein